MSLYPYPGDFTFERQKAEEEYRAELRYADLPECDCCGRKVDFVETSGLCKECESE